MVSVFGDNDGSIITDDLKRVTCKRCLSTRETRLRKLIAVERAVPGVFDYESLCGSQWLLDHALDVRWEEIDSQKLEVNDGERRVTVASGFKPKDRKYLISTISGKSR